MGAGCHDHACQTNADAAASPGFRRVLWVALALNLLMFVVEVAGGFNASSTSLLADAIDFAGDAFSYAISLAVLTMAAIWSSRAALLKGVVMIVFGVAVIGRTVSMLWAGTIPEAFTMGVIGALALAVNVAVAIMLYTFREGNANMRSVWLCSRNDAIGNLAIVAAAFGVFGTGSAWPDLIVAAIMATLAITAGVAVVRQSRAELLAINTATGDNLMHSSRANPRH